MIGVTGVPAVSPVVKVEPRSAHERVPILPRPTVDWTAKDLGKKQVNATLELAQVNWFVLRWLKTVSSTFQDVDFAGS